MKLEVQNKKPAIALRRLLLELKKQKIGPKRLLEISVRETRNWNSHYNKTKLRKFMAKISRKKSSKKYRKDNSEVILQQFQNDTHFDSKSSESESAVLNETTEVPFAGEPV